jgi:hypothetical protein
MREKIYLHDVTDIQIKLKMQYANYFVINIHGR